MNKAYRSEIDGLRGIAVLGVLFYHSEIVFQSFRIFPGGFLGVDLFFVISGYLITSLIIKEHQSNNFFSFINFYQRRVRRLLPALLVIISASSIASYFYLLPIQFEEFIKSVVSSIFFFSNFFFHFSGQAYGAQVLSEIPLLHTWSLSVEEQFYVLYPIFLIGLLTFIKKRISLIIIIGILSSLLFATIVNLNHQSFNFYMLPSRIWELLFGALLGVNINEFSIGKNKKTKEILAIFGFSIILLSFSFFQNTSDHPSYLTLIPVIGAYLIIQDGNKKNLINKFLSSKLLVFLGIISYSLYLWHHPIFSFVKIIGIEQKSLLLSISLMIVSIFLAFVTYRFIEKPFREKKVKILKIKKNHILGGSTILIIITLYSLINIQKTQYPTIAQHLYDKTWFATKTYFKPCFQRKTFICSFNENKKNQSVFLIGDSIMASIQEELKNKLIKRNFNFKPMTNAGCDFLAVNNNKKATCNKKIFENREKEISNKKEAIIILHINYEGVPSQKILVDFKNRVKKYLNKGHRVILIYPIPQMEKNVSVVIEKNIKNNKIPVNIVNIDLSKYLEKSKYIYTLFNSINHKNLYRTYPHRIFCNTVLKKKCIGNTHNYPYFIDTTHLSKKGSQLINMDLIKIIDSIY